MSVLGPVFQCKAPLRWAIKLVPNDGCRRIGNHCHQKAGKAFTTKIKLRISNELLQSSVHLGYPLPAVSLATFHFLAASQILRDPCSDIDIQICHCHPD